MRIAFCSSDALNKLLINISHSKAVGNYYVTWFGIDSRRRTEYVTLACKGAQIPKARLPGWINFVQWRPVFLGFLIWRIFISLFWPQQLQGGFWAPAWRRFFWRRGNEVQNTVKPAMLNTKKWTVCEIRFSLTPDVCAHLFLFFQVPSGEREKYSSGPCLTGKRSAGGKSAEKRPVLSPKPKISIIGNDFEIWPCRFLISLLQQYVYLNTHYNNFVWTVTAVFYHCHQNISHDCHLLSSLS